MNTIILGNIISLIGAVIMVSLGLVKKKEHVLVGQSVQCLIMGIGNVILGGYAGGINNVVAIVRNIMGVKTEFTKYHKLVFCAVPVVITLVVNQEGIYGWLPVIATCIFTLILSTKSDATVKFAVMAGQLCWLMYDIHNTNLTAAAFDVLCLITNVIGLWMIYRSTEKLQVAHEC